MQLAVSVRAGAVPEGAALAASCLRLHVEAARCHTFPGDHRLTLKRLRPEHVELSELVGHPSNRGRRSGCGALETF